MKKINIIESVMKSRQVLVAFVVALVCLGAIALVNMPRNEFPDFTIRQGVIVGVYPGATSLEVEEQLTTNIESYIFGYKEVNKSKTYSHSTEGQVIVFVELNDNVKDADKVWSKLRLGLSELKQSLPSGVVALIGTNDFGDTSALLVSMSSKSKTYRELEQEMKKLEKKVRKVNSVSKVKRYGEQKEKVYVYVQPDKLTQYNIEPTNILMMFKVQEALNYSGKLDNGELVLPVHLPPRFENEEDIAEQIVYSDPKGNIIRLKDVARIEKKYSEPDNYIRNNGNNALLLSLEMQQGNNIVEFGEEVTAIINSFKENADKDIDINIISNQPEVVGNSISHFMKEFAIAIIAVILVTMILLPFRVASVAGITIPVSILTTMSILQWLGFQLDIVSLAGLIVVLGMVVDNAIVVIDNHIEKLDQGESPWNAAWKAATELFVPILSATAAIIAAFLPLMFFMSGMAADFVGGFPMTITIALIVSLVVAILLVPAICYTFIKTGLHKKKEKNKKSFLDRVQNMYNQVLEACFRNPKKTILIGILSVVAAIGLFKTIDQSMFPAMDRKQFAVEVYLPEGTSVRKTEEVIDSLEHILMKDDKITNVASFIGNGSPRFHALYAPHMPASNYGQILVNTTSNDVTVELLDTYSKKYYGHFPNARIKWKQLAMEGFTSPIEIRISGDNISELKKSAERVEAICKKHDKTTWVRNDWKESLQGVTINLDRNKANELGYSKTLIASSLMTSLDGLPITTMWQGDYPIDVILAKEDSLTDDIRDLENQYVSSPFTMEALPLRSVSKLSPDWTEGNITHRNGIRTITVLVDMGRGTVYSQVFNDLKPEIEALDFPEGISLSYGGEYESTIENFIPMGISLGVSIILIFLILLLQFKTVRRALLIMSTMLLSLFGAAFGLKIVGYPFGMTSFIGVIGLMGITVRNGIILIDYAMALVTKEGYSYKDAAIAAGKRRMRPIFLTSMAAAIGVVPMIASQSLLWGPLGAVICFGLIFGMILTLFILPVLYWITTKEEKDEKITAELSNK